MSGIFGAAAAARGIETYTANGSFTVPAGVTTIWASMIGGGGGGGLDNSGYPSGGGASGNAVIRKKLTVLPGAVHTVTIGAGGAAGSVAPQSGSPGGTTSLGALVSAAGGAGGDSLRVGGAAGPGGVRGGSTVNPVATYYPAPRGGEGGVVSFFAGFGSGGRGTDCSPQNATEGQSGFLMIEY